MSLRYTVLALLSERPNTGYGIGRLLEERQAEYENAARDLREKLSEARREDQLGYQLTLEAALAEAKGQASWCAKAVARIRG